MILTFKDKKPDYQKAAFIAPNAAVVGDVILEEGSSVWFAASLRADFDSIHIGKNTNIQDGAVIHVDESAPASIGENVTVGHNAVLHGCTVQDNCLIGMGAVVLNRAVIGKGSVVGAGSLVTENKEFPPGSLIIGSPAKAIRQIRDEDKVRILNNARLYYKCALQTAGDVSEQGY